MEKLLSVAVISEKIGGNGFTLARKLIYINNLFLQDTITVPTHKRKRFLKEISIG